MVYTAPISCRSMKLQPASARVMVATDNTDDAEQICRQLKTDFEYVVASTKPDRGVEDFDEHKPDALVLAFDSLEKAQGYYLGLYRASGLAHQHPHRTVVLCHKDEVRAAFEFCKKEYFDDYVLYWPHAHDGSRLAMSIWIACREMVGARSTLPSAAALQTHARQLGELEHLLDDQLASGTKQIEAVKGTIKSTAALDGHQIVGAIESLGDWAHGFKDQLAPSLNATRGMSATFRDARLTVMVVDDDELTRTLIARALGSERYDMAFAADGTQALSLLRRSRPDVIFMDIQMPGLDGVSLTQRIKSTPHLADIPIIIMTGDARRETLMTSMHAGASAFVVKPFSRESLLAKLQKALG